MEKLKHDANRINSHRQPVYETFRLNRRTSLDAPKRTNWATSHQHPQQSGRHVRASF
jgi:hypothetical protein